MTIVLIPFMSFLAAAGFIRWALCASIPPDPEEDEEQERYLKEWRKKHEDKSHK